MQSKTNLQAAKKIIDEVLKTRPDLQRAKKLLDEERGDEPSFAEEFLAKFREGLQNHTPVETGWLIERHNNNVLTYWCGHKAEDFRAEVNNAIRFSRAEDAAAILSWLCSGHGRVAEHQWG